jgi:tetratricopeptide (TPR) repeat protein
MDKLCRASRSSHNLSVRARTKDAFSVIITCLLVCVAGGSNVVAAQKAVNARRAGSRPEARIPSPKPDLSGTVAGLKIVGVGPNSAAAQAGLRNGDVLIAYNNRPITTEEELYAVIGFFKHQFDQTGRHVTAELSLYRDGDMTVRNFRVLVGRLGIYTREWTLAGAFVQDAVLRLDDYVSAEKYAGEAAASGQYTDDQLLRMRIICLNNEKDGESIRQVQVDELFQKYDVEKLRFFANYDLLYHKRYRAGAAIFEKYLKIKPADVATELTLALSYTGMEKYDEAETLLAKILARPRTAQNAATEYGLSVLSNIQARIYMGRGQYDRAQASFKKALDQHPDDPYYTIAFLYCAARSEVAGEQAGSFETAYRTVSPRLEQTEELMGYHVDALRAFVLMNRRSISAARAAVVKWKDSADAKRYVPVFWQSFPDGVEIVNNWNLLMGQQGVARRKERSVFSR